MTHPPPNTVDLLHEIAAALEKDGPIEVATMFRNPGLRTGKKIVAFLGHGDRLIVKLPAARAAALLNDGTAEAVTMGKRTLREWVAIPANNDPEITRMNWTGLAREALLYVRA